MTAFDTLLIANRGEIARRVIRTARALGLRTVAVFTDADAEALHVREADHAVRIPSYLDVTAVVAAATVSGVPSSTAVHPGYGFLSERADLPRALEAAGVTFVGPTGDVMDAMGRKDRAREIATAAGVPVVPNWESGSALEAADFPVLVKAAAGGGGKGMRVVHSSDELAEAQAAAAREATKAFGDDTLLLEKYVARGRHIEVQVFGDTLGNVVHLFERDCSTQRRHQKVLEEAPAPTLTDAQRELVTSSAVALAQRVGYTGAGTVEFLLDDATGEAYFLEMNTRLQVEHPVTEEVIRVRGERIDLVSLQLRIAAGGSLGFGQDDVTVAGHAIEARVYAEDAWHGFLPQAGTASYVDWPGTADGTESGTADGTESGTRGVRVDHALVSGQVVSTGFDPMLGKVIAVGADREAARRQLVDALGDTAILGLTTNVGFLRSLAASDEFRDASIDTAWLDRTEIAGLTDPAQDEQVAGIGSALAELLDLRNGDAGPLRSDGWRDGASAASFRLTGATLVVTGARSATIRATSPEMAATSAVICATSVDEGSGVRRVEFRLDGAGTGDHTGRHTAYVRAGRDEVEVVLDGQRHVITRPGAHREHTAAASDGSILAPMPGTVLDVRVREGEAVTAGQVLGVMEAMKMELTLTAPYDGVVTVVETETGAQVVLGARLFHVDGAESSA